MVRSYLIQHKVQLDTLIKRQKHQPKGTNRALGRIIASLHLWLGLGAGAVLLTVALSGALLAFEEEITPVLYSREQYVTPGKESFTMDALIARAAQVYPEKKIFRIERNTDPERSVKVLYGAKKEGYSYTYLDPYSGAVLSQGEQNNRFFSIVLNLHRFLLAGEVGKVITGISCCITILMAFSGIYLWWPSNKNMWKQRVKVKRGASRKRFTWDLHAVGGFYSALFLLLICFTGIVWSFDWVENQIFIWADGKVEKEPKVENRTAQGDIANGVFELIWKESNRIFPYLGNISLTMPAKKGLAITVSKENLEKTVVTSDLAYFDSKTGDLLALKPFAAMSKGNKIRKMVKPLHTGSILGWPTKIINFLTALLTASLPVTGFLIWYNKKRKKKKTHIVKLRSTEMKAS